MDDRIPPFLTVEEASRLLKIGRTKAYDLTKEWRATGGRYGLPVIDLGDVLRVPGPAIEQMLGTGLGAPCPSRGTSAGKPAEPNTPIPGVPAPPPAPREEPPTEPVQPPVAAPPVAAPAAAPCVAPVRARRPRRRPSNQLPLLQALTATNPNPETPSLHDPEPTQQ